MDSDKITEAIIYLAQCVDSLTVEKLYKLLHFADLEHLQKYGRTITGISQMLTEKIKESF